MTAEGTCWSKLTEPVSDHILSYKDINEGFTIVNRKRMTDKIRHNHGPSRPCLDRSLPPGPVERLHLLRQVIIDERSFLNGSTHYFFLRCNMNFVEAFLLFLVRCPLASLPQGDIGCPPPLLRPSPPPIGWSTGFMTTPRT